MTIEELLRNLKRHISVTIDIRPIEGLPGLLRFTTIFTDLRVEIEFFKWESLLRPDPMEAGWPGYLGSYSNQDELIEDLEEYLGLPLSQWSSFTSRPYLDENAIKDYIQGLLVSGCDLPKRAKFRLP